MRKRRLYSLIALTVAALFLPIRPVQAADPIAWPESVQRGVNLGGTSYSEEDIAWLARDWRANIARVLVNDLVSSTAPYQVKAASRDALFRLIDLCLKYQLYTVVSFSASFDNHDNFFSNPALKAAFTAFWKEVAARYATSGPIAYDLMNEPHDELANTQWSAYAQELTDSIRTVDKVHTIVIEPPAWGWPDGFANLKPTTDKNTVYSFHFYGPMDYTHQRFGGQMMNTPEWAWQSRAYPGTIPDEWGGQEYWDKTKMRTYIQKATAFRTKYGVRLWCGEFGCARWAIGAKQWFTDWIDLLEEQKIDWAYYSYREWHHMDIEMDPSERKNRTARGETELLGLFRGYFARNAVETDFNRDGFIDLSDALEMARFQLKHPGSLGADFNRDGRAGVLDLLNLLLRLKAGN